MLPIISCFYHGLWPWLLIKTTLLSPIRDDPSFPALAADWLCTALRDRKSYSGFKARCEEAWRGELSVDRLLEAYEQATGPMARNPGAIFMYAVRGDARDG